MVSLAKERVCPLGMSAIGNWNDSFEALFPNRDNYEY